MFWFLKPIKLILTSLIFNRSNSTKISVCQYSNAILPITQFLLLNLFPSHLRVLFVKVLFLAQCKCLWFKGLLQIAGEAIDSRVSKFLIFLLKVITFIKE